MDSHHDEIRVVSARARQGLGAMLADVWANRSIMLMLMQRDLRIRYAGSMLGVLWNVIHPIIMIAIYILILGTIISHKFGGGMDRGSYVIHLCAGMIPWLVFQEVLTRCSYTILENASLIKKVAFPEIVLHLVVTINAMLVHTVSYAAFIIILSFMGGWPGWPVLTCFGLLLCVGVFALGLGLIASVLNIYFRDISQVVNVALQFLFWFTPIVYPASFLYQAQGAVVQKLRVLMEFNPMLHFVRLSQWLFGDSPQEAWFSWTSFAVVTGGSLLSLVIGLFFFNHFKRDILDNI